MVITVHKFISDKDYNFYTCNCRYEVNVAQVDKQVCIL